MHSPIFTCVYLCLPVFTCIAGKDSDLSSDLSLVVVEELESRGRDRLRSPDLDSLGTNQVFYVKLTRLESVSVLDSLS